MLWGWGQVHLHIFQCPQGDQDIDPLYLCVVSPQVWVEPWVVKFLAQAFTLGCLGYTFGLTYFHWCQNLRMKTRLISLASKPIYENKVNFIGVQTYG